MSQKLTPKQYKALYMLVDGYALSTIAKRVGVRRETISRWQHLPHFKEEYDRCLTIMDEEVKRDRAIVRAAVMERLQKTIYSDPYISIAQLTSLLDRFSPQTS